MLATPKLYLAAWLSPSLVLSAGLGLVLILINPFESVGRRSGSTLWACQESLFRDPLMEGKKFESLAELQSLPEVNPAVDSLADRLRPTENTQTEIARSGNTRPASGVQNLPRNENLTDDNATEEIFPQQYFRQDLGTLQDIDGSSEQGSPSGGARERIVQRYPDGTPQIIREMIQDKSGNYVHDGSWTLLAPGNERVVLANGSYRLGQMEGVWERKHQRSSSDLFQVVPFTLFSEPFTSRADFRENQLDGYWQLLDSENRKIFEIPYHRGSREGTALWFYPSQQKMREATFRDGLLHGRVREWSEAGEMTRDEEFVEGQRILRNVTYYRPQQKESESYFLEPRLEIDGQDDWWNARPAPWQAVGYQQQHGFVQLWYENGLPKMRGEYVNDERVGSFTWWHPNGNISLQGAYEKGLKTGRWTWFHENGIKSCEGMYYQDEPVNEWTTWNSDGKVEKRETLEPAATAPRLNPRLNPLPDPKLDDSELDDRSIESDQDRNRRENRSEDQSENRGGDFLEELPPGRPAHSGEGKSPTLDPTTTYLRPSEGLAPSELPDFNSELLRLPTPW